MLRNTIEPVDYLAIGHLTCDLEPAGARLGGTVAYAALTARALGLQAGIVTSVGDDVSLDRLSKFPIAGIYAEKSTTFENVITPTGRRQKIHHVAPMLRPHMVPSTWRSTPIVHFGPVAHEIDLSLLRLFPEAFIGMTPQGWLRDWDQAGRVTPTEWPEASYVLQKAHAAVISIEDVDGDEKRVEEMAASCPVLVVTEGEPGGRLFWEGETYPFSASPFATVDPVGAGDIFAAVFFIHLHKTGDPLASVQFASYLAAVSVTRTGLDSIPTLDEIQSYLAMVN